MRRTAEILYWPSIGLQVGNVCRQVQFTREKYLLPNPTTMTKFTLELQKSRSKIDSTTILDPLLVNITQITQNWKKNTGKLKGATLFQN